VYDTGIIIIVGDEELNMQPHTAVGGLNNFCVEQNVVIIDIAAK